MLDTIFPVMGQTTCALIAISTALDDDNHYSALTKLVDPDTGNPLFNVITLTQICEACKKTETPWLCNHRAFDVPPWKSERKQNKLKQMYKGNEHRFQRETMGGIAGGGRAAFKTNLIENFKNAMPITITKKPNIVFVGCDPGGGGPSDLAITGMVQKEGMWVIMCLVATTVTKGASEEELVLKTTMDLILRSPDYEDALIVFMPENAPAIAASHLYSYLLSYPRVLTLHETVSQRAGVPITNQIKRDFQFLFEGLLATDTIRYAKKIITFRNTVQEMKQKLEDQMGKFKWEQCKSTNEADDVRYKLHGKEGGENDDLLISCLMVPYWSRIFYTSNNPLYSEYQFYARNGYFRNSLPLRYDSNQAYYRLDR